MPKLLTVVLGAGSSHDCADPNVTPVEVAYKPPLVKDLFELRTSFNDILTQYQAARTIADDLRTRLAQPGANLEELLKELESRQDLSRRRQYWEVPLYFQHLLWDVSLKYVGPNSTKFHTLLNSISDYSFDRVLFFTLNYDLFLERALSDCANIRFESMDSYGRKDGLWCVVKAHGSVNWGRRLLNQPSGIGNWGDILRNLSEPPALDKDFTILEGGEVGHPSHFQSRRYVGGIFHYPSLGIPVAGKDSFYCPKEHIEVARAFMKECENFLVIGFSANDSHVLECFKSVSQIRNLMVVNGKKEESREALERLSKFTPVIRDQWYRSWEACCYDGGFLNFMYNNKHRRFFDAC